MFSHRNLSHLHDVSGLGAFIFVCVKEIKRSLIEAFRVPVSEDSKGRLQVGDVRVNTDRSFHRDWVPQDGLCVLGVKGSLRCPWVIVDVNRLSHRFVLLRVASHGYFG